MKDQFTLFTAFIFAAACTPIPDALDLMDTQMTSDIGDSGTGADSVENPFPEATETETTGTDTGTTNTDDAETEMPETTDTHDPETEAETAGGDDTKPETETIGTDAGTTNTSDTETRTNGTDDTETTIADTGTIGTEASDTPTDTTGTEDPETQTDPTGTDTQTDTIVVDDTETDATDTGCETGWTGERCDVTQDCSDRRDMVPCQLEGHRGERTVCLDETCKKLGCGDETCLATGPSFPLGDTRMFLCFDNQGEIDCLLDSLGECGETDAFCGQDADYGSDAGSSAAHRWVLVEEGDEPVVEDLETGLGWQGCPAGGTGALCEAELDRLLYWEEAVAYCDHLDWGGYDDWYLPDAYELLSIVHFGNPSQIDLLFFPHTDQFFFWTSNWVGPYAAGEVTCDMAWAFWFVLGQFTPYPWPFYPFPEKAQVRCVRRHGMKLSKWTRDHADRPRFVRRYQTESKNQFYVRDQSTGLLWQGCPAGLEGELCTSGKAKTKTWEEALAYCQSLTWDNLEGWRLPSVKELHSAMMFTTIESPSLDPKWFPGPLEQGDHFWTSTTFLEYTDQAFTGNLEGMFTRQTKSEFVHVMCVKDL